MIEIEKRTVQVEFRLPFLHMVVSSCFSILYSAYWRSEGDESWTTTTAALEEMGRKNGDAVRIMSGGGESRKLRGAATPGLMYKMELGKNLEKTVPVLLNTTSCF